MVLAIVIGILAAVAVAAVIVAVIVMRNSADETVSAKSKVSQVGSVGVASTLPGADGGSRATHVKSEIDTDGTLVPDMKNRFRILIGFAAAVFGVLGVKAFQMQVVNNATFSSKSEENAISTVSTPAPRGLIYDCDGVCLVNNRSSLTVLADSDVSDDDNVVSRLSAVLGVPRSIVRKRISDSSSGAQSQRVVAKDVRKRDIAFITEHSDAFSGVSVETRTVRQYPYAALASHVLGYAGTVSEEELAEIPSGRDIKSGDNIGKSGVEQYYDQFLAGAHGEKKVMADAEGNVHSVVSETKPTQGSNIILTIAAPVQYVADKGLKELVAPSGDIGSGTGKAASLVCMDVRDGSIVAMANYPTYNPETFVGGIPEDIWALYNTEESHYPLVNRAIAGAYPAASTYKAFTGIAGLTYGFADDKTTWDCGGGWDGFGSGDIQNCWQLAGHGTLDLHGGIVNSCDIVFYEIAKDFFYAGVSQGGNLSDTAMQEIIEQFHFGQKSGIDLQGEAQGRVPTPRWKAEYYKDVPEEATWRGGDMTNMVIGQGYVLVTPIQQCVAYAGMATGKLMKPHVLKKVLNSEGETVVEVKAEELGRPNVTEENRKYIKEALKGVAEASFASEFYSNGIDGACKTGTAEVSGQKDYSLFCAYAPADDPHYVVASVNEASGGGHEAASLCIEVLAAAINHESGQLTEVQAIAASSGKTVEKTEDDNTQTTSRTD